MAVTSYMSRAFLKRRETVRDMVALVKNSGIKFDFVAFRGTSGALIAPCVAERLRKPFVMVRKKDGSHAHYEVEIPMVLTEKSEPLNYIVIDDLVSTGDTVKEIEKKLNNEVKERHLALPPTLKGVFLYQPSLWTSLDGVRRILNVPIYALPLGE